MTGVAVAKEKKTTDPVPPTDGNRVTTIKTKVRIAEMLDQIASMRRVKNQDALDHYAKLFEDDLLKLMADKLASLTGKRPPV